MVYKAKVAVCSEIRTKHSMQSERHVEFLNVKPGGTERNRLALKGCFKDEAQTALFKDPVRTAQ